MGSRYSALFKESTIPGLSTIFASKPRASKLLLMNVLIILVILTFKDLYSIASDYFNYPITVSVLVTESRVLPFPAVTVCNLNPIHRGRFCSSNDISKPENIDKIVCTDLTDLFEVCKITESLKDLVEEGRAICEGTSSNSGSSRKKQNRKLATPKKRKTQNTTSNSNTNTRTNLKNNNSTNKPKVRKPKPRRIGNRKSTTTESSNGVSTTTALTTIETTKSTETGLNIPDDISAKNIPGIDPFTRRAIDRKIKNLKNDATDLLAAGGGGGSGGNGQSGQQSIDSQTVFVVKRSKVTDAVIKNEYYHQQDEQADGKQEAVEGDANDEEGEEEQEEEEEEKGEEKEEEDKDEENDQDEEDKMKQPQRFNFQSGLCPSVKRSKRGDPQFNLRTLMATFKSVQKGNFTGGLLEPFMVSCKFFFYLLTDHGWRQNYF